MAKKSLSYWLGILGLLICLPIGACNCNNSTPEASEKDQKAQADEPTDEDKGEKKAENYPDDLYPGFNFGVLEDDEKEQFVKIAQAELCPCPDSASSLHECLKSANNRCGLAQQSATLIAMGLKEGLTSTDVMDKLAEYVAATKKAYDFELENTPVKGNPKAKVVIVEFADFECPFCREVSKELKVVSRKFGDDVAIYYKHFPLGGHKNGELAARASVAAQNQDRFWPMHDMLFEHQKSLSEAKIIQLAASIGLNMEKFKRDLTSPMTIAKVQADRKEGEDANLTGTPTLFMNGVRYMGGRTEADISRAVQARLEEAEKPEEKDTKGTTN